MTVQLQWIFRILSCERSTAVLLQTVWTAFHQCPNAHHTDNSSLLTLGSPCSPGVIPSPPKMWDGLVNSQGHSERMESESEREGGRERKKRMREERQHLVSDLPGPLHSPKRAPVPILLVLSLPVHLVFFERDRTGDAHSVGFSLTRGRYGHAEKRK